MTEMTLTQWLARIEEAYQPASTVLGIWQNIEAERLGREKPYPNERDGLLEYILNEFADLRFEDDMDSDIAVATELYNRLATATEDLMRVRYMLDEVTVGKHAQPAQEQTYGGTSWTVDDIVKYRIDKGLPEWTFKQAREWLESNERQIRDDAVVQGWASIEALMPVDADDGDES